MAQSLETLRGKSITNIHGRRLGLDSDETIVGAKAVKQVVQDLTSADNGETINAYGTVVARITGVPTSANVGFFLSNPIPGVAVTICKANTSQAATAASTGTPFQRASTAFYIQSSVGSTGVAVVLAHGQSITLLGISTDAYMAQVAGGSAVATITGTS